MALCEPQANTSRLGVCWMSSFCRVRVLRLCSTELEQYLNFFEKEKNKHGLSDFKCKYVAGNHTGRPGVRVIDTIIIKNRIVYQEL